MHLSFKYILASILKYKLWITAALVALQLFICMPVQLWHHHNSTIASASKSALNALNKTPDLNAQSDINSDTNCQICGHHYSSYGAFPEIISALNHNFKSSELSIQIVNLPHVPLFHLTNRGPPTA